MKGVSMPASYTIGILSEYARAFLDHTSASGVIHSVYRKTVNLSFGGQLLALQARQSPLSPISLVTDLSSDELSALRPACGLPVSIQNGALFLKDCCSFSYRAARTEDLALEHCCTRTAPLCSLQKEAASAALEEAVFRVLSQCNTGSFDLLFTDPKSTIQSDIRSDMPLYLTAAKACLNTVTGHLSSGLWSDAAAALCRLLGLGIGLTPGGDDFLCGALAGLLLCDCTRHPFARQLSSCIAKRLNDTVEISAAFLTCALNGQFSMAVKQLTQSPPAQQILSAFQEIGHSSGIDTLSGIYFILKNRKYFVSH